MSASLDPTLRNLNDCECCEGISAETPANVFNRPGLSALAYRVGAHPQFKETMLARISGSHQPALRGLNTRADDDFSIALLDGWATVADVLTFYQERIANENYLRTATERLSILEMARLIGYELRPGVAARTYLAFTLEDAPGAFGQAINLSNIAQGVPEAPPPITIDIGVKAQSVPAPGEQAQTFETVEAIEARVEWNAIKPRMTQPQTLSVTMSRVFIEGTVTNLKAGDKLLIDVGANRQMRTIFRVTPDDEAKLTRIDFSASAASSSYTRPSGLTKGQTASFPTKQPLNTNTVDSIVGLQWEEKDLSALVKSQNWSGASFKASVTRKNKGKKFSGGNGVFAFRQRPSIFGSNALKELSFDTNGRPKPQSQWAEWTLDNSEADNTLFLDAPYEMILPGSFIAVHKPGATEPSIFTVGAVETRSRNAYGLSAKTTIVTLASGQTWWQHATENFGVIRGTVVYAQSESLPLAAAPITDVVAGDEVTLDDLYLGLKKGRKVVLTGERDDLAGVIESELLTIKEVIIENGFTVLAFEDVLVNRYVRKTVTINANVAFATHGETVQETLGSGDATVAFQRFTLRQPPLTYVGAQTPTGAATTLEIRVNDLLWQEVDDFFGRGPNERIYITETGDDGKTTVVFGDGRTGARLPTGVENVKAKYRKGIGLGGLVKAHQLSQLMTKPLGVKAATNPFAADSAQDPEQLADARRNAPLTVLTLGRVVSLQDYEDFARAFSGVAKALATWSWSGEQRVVLLTVAGGGGAEIETTSDLYKDLLAALRKFGDPNVPLRMESFVPRSFRLAANLRVAPDRLPEKVRAEVEAVLRARYSFDAREFGQPVHLSEAIGLMQNVSGVVSVTVTDFRRPDLNATPIVLNHLPAARPQLNGNSVVAAEMLTLDPSPVPLTAELVSLSQSQPPSQTSSQLANSMEAM